MSREDIFFWRVVVAVLGQRHQLGQAAQIICQCLCRPFKFCVVEPVSHHRSVDLVQLEILAPEMCREYLYGLDVLAQGGQLAPVTVLNKEFIP